jgi:hypothetical protein
MNVYNLLLIEKKDFITIFSINYFITICIIYGEEEIKTILVVISTISSIATIF